MNSPISADGRAVLLHSPQPGVSERIQALLDAGARMTVRCANPDATLRDLASRRLIELVADADPLAFDIVLRDHERVMDARQERKVGDDSGRVTLVGGGPGDQGLLTIAGMQAVREADVLVCDRLAPLGALKEARPDAEVIHVGKIPRGEFTPQEAINDALIEHARSGKHVVRLKGGDSFVFGRGGEEWNACVAAGVPVDVIPGVSSAIAAAELVGIPVTHRAVTQGFIVVSGHVGPDDHRNAVDWGALASSGLTIVVLMGVAALRQIADRLIAEGLPSSTPAACVAGASMSSQRQVTGTLADIDRHAAEAGISAPAVTVVGHVVTALQR